MGKLTLEVVTPHGVTFSDTVDFVSVFGTSGELGILPNHIPLFTGLKIEVLKYRKNNQDNFLAVMGGFLEVADNKINILSKSSERADSIDVLRAQQDKEKAEKEMMRKAGAEAFERATREVVKAQARLKAVDLLEKAGGRRVRGV